MASRHTPARTTLAKNLKALMDHLEIKQSALGKRAGIAQSTVGRILQEKHAPDIDTIEALGRALGVSLWQLLVPGLDPANPPLLQNASPEERELYERLKQAAVVFGRKTS
jgi:transcriptional regulator with XRE-family HTH domain